MRSFLRRALLLLILTAGLFPAAAPALIVVGAVAAWV